jgi:hypothetical protein
MGDSSGRWDDLEAQLEAQLGELNELATRQLEFNEDLEPAPDGLPPAGSWIRAQRVDLDGVARPIGPWHLVTTWNASSGCLSVRCSRYRPGYVLREAVSAYLGQSGPWHRRDGRTRLLVAPGAPAEACRRCEAALARDAMAREAAAAEADRQATLALLPRLEALAGDVSIDDAERGRRFRALWEVAR